MNKRFFSILFTGAMLSIVAIGFTQVLNKKPEQEVNPAMETASKVTEYKKKSREALKPYKYDASNVTHYSFAAFEQRKEIEIMLFNGTEYKLNFNMEGSPKPITVQIYDKPMSNQKRNKIKEFPNVQGAGFDVITKELMTEGTSLKRIYVDYIIPANDSKEPLKGFAILTYGYKNI
jgi:hypothetical protein